ncbi:MAG: response regulator [Victivallales bacterium]
MEKISDKQLSGTELLANILIVDDTPANLLLLDKMFADRGYKTRSVLSGKLALQAARSEPPDLILLDINMPEMNGYEVCEQFKADAKLKDIPVIFISALSETIDKIKAFAVVGVDYVTKPFQLEEVDARVRTHLELRRLRLELERQNRRLQENYDHLGKLEDLQDKLTHMFVHDMRLPLIGVTGYLETLEMDAGRKLDSNELEILRKARNNGLVLVGMINSLMDVPIVCNRGRRGK